MIAGQQDSHFEALVQRRLADFRAQGEESQISLADFEGDFHSSEQVEHAAKVPEAWKRQV